MVSTPIDIQAYSGGWMAPLHLDRLFVDSLKSDPRVGEFKPQEIQPKKKSDLTASNVAGALSTLVVGIGWKRVQLPTSIIGFDSCPVQLAVFSRHDDFMRARFFFPALFRRNPGEWGVVFVRRKGAGVLSSGDPNELEIAPQGGSSPGIDGMREDKPMVARFLSLASKGLNQKPWICTIGYQMMGSIPAGKIEFDIQHKKKKWEKTLQELNFKPEDYVFDVFSSACSVAGHICSHIRSTSPPTIEVGEPVPSCAYICQNCGKEYDESKWRMSVECQECHAWFCSSGKCLEFLSKSGTCPKCGNPFTQEQRQHLETRARGESEPKAQEEPQLPRNDEQELYWKCPRCLRQNAMNAKICTRCGSERPKESDLTEL